MIEVFDCNFDNQEHCNALLALMNHYMQDQMGGVDPHTAESGQKFIQGMKEHPSKVCLLAKMGDSYCGMTNCFVNFGTFAARPFINIHDIVVLDSCRGKGVGRALMNAITDRARQLNCAKITLEVRADSQVAQKLYKSIGYCESTPVMHFWTKKL